MDFFTEAVPTQAYLKAGIIGGAGDGKTYTAAEIAIGLQRHLRERGLGEKSVAFLETSEMGVHWLIPKFAEAGIKLLHRRTRAFKDFAEGMRRAADNDLILVVDSVTGYWQEIVESYKEQLKRPILAMEDWGPLKEQWGYAMEEYKNLPAHMILCGRAGFEYGRFENDVTGRMDLERTGVKMRAEGDTGYEPSLLLYMKKQQDLTDPTRPRLYHTATVLKDRSQQIHGRTFDNPTFETILPHVNGLALGGNHIGAGEENSREIVVDPRSGRAWYEEKTCVLDEIEALMSNKIPGMSADDKKRRGDLLQAHFGTLSRERLRTLSLEQLERGYKSLHVELVGAPPTIPGRAATPAPAPAEGHPENPLTQLKEHFAATPAPAPAGEAPPIVRDAAPVHKPGTNGDAQLAKIQESVVNVEQAPPPIKRKPGRPRKNPLPEPAAPATASEPGPAPEPMPDAPAAAEAPAAAPADVVAQSEADHKEESERRARAALEQATGPAEAPSEPKRGRGRPKGSKNRPKGETAPEVKPAAAAASGPDVGKWDTFIVEGAKAAAAQGIKGEAWQRGVNTTLMKAELLAISSEKFPPEFLKDWYDAIVEGRWDAKAGEFRAAEAPAPAAPAEAVAV